MTRRLLTSTLAALFVGLAGALALAAPAAAGTIYPPSGACTVSPTTASAGESLTFRCEAGTFSPDETVTITVTGRNGGDARIGMIRTAVSTANGRAAATPDGGLNGVRIALPSSASGVYNIAAISSSSAGGTATVSIATEGGLPTTGMDSGTTLSLWIGGGALVVAGVVVVTTIALRRRHED